MADGDFSVVEKSDRPKDYRLDLADFSVVNRNTWAKGVITEFQKNGDDPMAMQSLVKVKVAEVESDFIPIFFRPKKDYWDFWGIDPTLGPTLYKSQEVNQEDKYYKNAWMSFRIGDEVKVMLVDGTPVAVLGFLDNVPREGEAVIKVVGAQDTNYIQCNQMNAVDISERFWAGKENGPDGKPLQLTKKAENILSLSYELTLVDGNWIYGSDGPYFGHFYFEYYTPTVWTGASWLQQQVYYNADYTMMRINSRLINNKQRYTIRHYLTAVGPILYCFQFVWTSYYSDTEHDNRVYNQSTSNNVGGLSPAPPAPEYDGTNLAAIADFSFNVIVQNATDYYNANIDKINSYKSGVYTETGEWNQTTLQCVTVMAAPYSDELYEQIKSSASSPQPPAGSACIDFQEDYGSLIRQSAFSSALNSIAESLVNAEHSDPPADIDFYTRPHSVET